MSTERPTHDGFLRVPLALAAALGIAWSGCSGSGGRFSGRYEADLGGGSAVLDFQGGNKVNVSLVSGKDSLTHHCIYVVAEDKMLITTDEPMGVPMNLIIDGDVLKDGGGTVYMKK
jgi:hypothetical protein